MPEEVVATLYPNCLEAEALKHTFEAGRFDGGETEAQTRTSTVTTSGPGRSGLGTDPRSFCRVSTAKRIVCLIRARASRRVRP